MSCRLRQTVACPTTSTRRRLCNLLRPSKCGARGGQIEVGLGAWEPKRIAILEFDSLDRIHAWLGSPEYTALDDIRGRSSNINLIVVEGV